MPARREAFSTVSVPGVGSLALTSLLRAEERGLQPRKGHLPARAKRCIFLMMEGWPVPHRHLRSEARAHQAPPPGSSRGTAKSRARCRPGKRYFVQKPLRVHQGRARAAPTSAPSGSTCREMVDEMCFYRGAQVESVNHPTACYHVEYREPASGATPRVGCMGHLRTGVARTRTSPVSSSFPAIRLPAGRRRPIGRTATCRPTSRGLPLRPAGKPDPRPESPTRNVSAATPAEANLDLLARLNRQSLRGSART